MELLIPPEDATHRETGEYEEDMSGGRSKKTELVRYNPEMAEAVMGGLLIRPEGEVDRARPLTEICPLIAPPWDESLLSAIKEYSAAEIAYYMLMASRKNLPSFSPVHDVCLLAANVLRSRLTAGQPLVLLDWELLPAAVLATEGGASVTLPSNAAGQEQEIGGIVAGLRRYLSKTEWNIPAGNDVPLPDGCLVLGQDPLRHGERDPRFLDKLKEISGGIFVSSWDFLGVKIYSHTRAQWLKTGLVRGVLQLPRPRRQTTAVYPALVELGAADPKRALRLARVAAWNPGPGALDQSAAVALLVHPLPAANKDALDVPPDAFAKDGLFDLSPSAHLARQKEDQTAFRGGDRLTLRQCAQVLHCQLPRKSLDEDAIDNLADWSDYYHRERWGEWKEGFFIAREVALAELDPLTGFLNDRGCIVELQLTLLGKQGKYVLQANDILFTFRGAPSSIGKVGFVKDDDIIAIAGRTMCVIRCLPGIDPVWLYYYLQRQSVREWVRGRASGKAFLTINLESIRDMPIELPGQGEIDAVNKEHLKIATAMAAITERYRDIDEAKRSIHEINPPQEPGDQPGHKTRFGDGREEG